MQHCFSVSHDNIFGLDKCFLVWCNCVHILVSWPFWINHTFIVNNIHLETLEWVNKITEMVHSVNYTTQSWNIWKDTMILFFSEMSLSIFWTPLWWPQPNRVILPQFTLFHLICLLPVVVQSTTPQQLRQLSLSRLELIFNLTLFYTRCTHLNTVVLDTLFLWY